MRATAVLSFGLCLTSLASLGAAAQSPPFTPFQISGVGNVEIASVNDSGVAAGSYWAAGSSTALGFAGRLGRVVTLQSLTTSAYEGNPIPSSINDQGYVVGTFMKGGGNGFVWTAGHYVADFALGSLSPEVPTPVIAAGNTIGYNFNAALGSYYIYAGKLSSPQRVNVGGFAVMQSVNSKGQVAGQFEWFIGRSLVNAVFLAKNSEVEPLLPPGAVSSTGGFLNEQGNVGGSFVDQSGVINGFIYVSGSYQIFSISAKISRLSVQGIDTAGTVVGTYADSSSQHAFIYRKGEVTKFGTWDVKDNVELRLSPLGAWIALSVQPASSNSSLAYLAHCKC